MQNIEDLESVETHIKELYGNEDKFVEGYRHNNFYTEVNGAKGIIRMNELDENNSVINSYDINLYETANSMLSDIKEDIQDESIDSRKIAVLNKVSTGSPMESYSLAVYTKGSYNSTFRVSIGNSKGTLKNYYKDGAWETGSTSKFYGSLKEAKGEVSTIKKRINNGAIFATVMTAMTKFLPGSATNFVDEVVALLGTMGIMSVTAVALGPGLVRYIIDVRNLGSHYNSIVRSLL